jgi:Flp pilus assembly protein protease CpaA
MQLESSMTLLLLIVIWMMSDISYHIISYRVVVVVVVVVVGSVHVEHHFGCNLLVLVLFDLHNLHCGLYKSSNVIEVIQRATELRGSNSG